MPLSPSPAGSTQTADRVAKTPADFFLLRAAANSFWLRFAFSIVAGLVLGATAVAVPMDRAIPVVALLALLGIAIGLGYRVAVRDETIAELRKRLSDESSYRDFVSHAMQGFFRTTRDGRFILVNPALARIYGYDSPEQLQSELVDIGSVLYVDPLRRVEFAARMKHKGMVTDFVSEIWRRDGTAIWITESARTVTDENGQFLFYEGTVEDVTAKHRSEETTRRALQEAQGSARAKAAFLSAMSHELKTPLNAVIGFSELMRNELLGPIGEPRYRAYVCDIHDNGRRLLRMIEDILDITRIEGGLLTLDERPVNLRDAAMAALARLMEEHPEPRLVSIDVPADVPDMLADSKRMQQIIGHLLSNALKFTPPEGRVNFSASCSSQGAITLQVKDTGMGMAPEKIVQALEPFKQLDETLSRRFEGAGLGLPLTNALVRLHGGTIAIDSEPGAGTVATVRFLPGRTILTPLAAAG